jgi:hypothetical protein
MLTGADFHEEHVLDDGTSVTLRHIAPSDVDELGRAFERLSPLSRHNRFLGAPSVLSDATLRYLTEVDRDNHVAIVAESAGQGLGVARFIRDSEEPMVAEPAITIVDAMQRKGLGRILAVALARAALERGVRTFRGDILADNSAVRKLLDEVGATFTRASADELTFEVDLGPPGEPNAGERLDLLARRLLRAAAERLVGWRRFTPL